VPTAGFPLRETAVSTTLGTANRKVSGKSNFCYGVVNVSGVIVDEGSSEGGNRLPSVVGSPNSTMATAAGAGAIYKVIIIKY